MGSQLCPDPLRESELNAQEPRPERKNYFRWLNEFLFSLNATLLVIPVASVRMKYPLLMRGRDLSNFVYNHLPFAIPSFLRNVEPYDQYFIALVLACVVLLFLIFRIMARFPITLSFLQIAPGVTALLGLPLALRLQGPYPFGLLLEGFAAAVCALFYLYGKWKLPSVITILFLACHFAFWAWGTWQMRFGLAYPVVGFCSVLTWAAFCKSERARY